MSLALVYSAADPLTAKTRPPAPAPQTFEEAIELVQSFADACNAKGQAQSALVLYETVRSLRARRRSA